MGSTSCSKCSLSKPEQLSEAEAGNGERRTRPAPRTSMKLKDGGFALSVLQPSNRGSIKDLYFLDDDVLGEGAYSVVTKCSKKQTLQSYAVKRINKAVMRTPTQFDNEIDIMRQMDHPNLVRMIETFRDDSDLYIVLELCEGGQLFDSIVDRGAVAERPAAMVAVQLLRAVSYLHVNHVTHRDLKAENFLLADDVPMETSTIKLCDFGLAKLFQPGDFMKTRCGTPYYVAPEVLDGKYNELADVWSIGVILYMLLNGSPPFVGNNTREVLDKIRHADVNPKKMSKPPSLECRECLTGLLKKSPEERISAYSAIKHVWFERILQDLEFAAKRGGALRNTLKAGNYGGLGVNVAAGLKHYAEASSMQKAIIRAVSSQLSQEAMADLQEVFFQFDVSGDGALGKSEFTEGMKRAGVVIDAEEVDAIFSGIDADGSGSIDYSEFIAAMMDGSRANQEDACFKAFQLFDLDNNGTIEREELEQLLQNHELMGAVNSQDIDDFFLKLNKCEDQITFEDFVTMINELDESGTSFPTTFDTNAVLKSARRLTKLVSMGKPLADLDVSPRKSTRKSTKKQTVSRQTQSAQKVSPRQTVSKQSQSSPRKSPRQTQKEEDGSPPEESGKGSSSPRQSEKKMTSEQRQAGRKSAKKKTTGMSKASSTKSSKSAS